jgi:hypothetical protein
MLLSAHIPLGKLLLGASEKVGEMSASALQRYAHKQLHEASNISTPYGTLVKERHVTGTSGDCTFSYICPFALLFQLSLTNENFAVCLLQCLQAAAGRVCLYIDQVVPGNALRPGPHRSFEALYWSILELPSWLRERVGAIGWFTLAYVPSAELEECGVSPGVLMAEVFRIFWDPSPDGHSFATTGILLRVNGNANLVRLVYAYFLGDEKAIKEVFSLKGASSKRPCVNCANVVGRTEEDEVVDGLVHVRDPDFKQFKAQSVEMFRVVVQLMLDAVAAHGAASTFVKSMEIKLGVNYQPSALIWCPELLPICMVPASVYWDWMHVMFSNGVWLP